MPTIKKTIETHVLLLLWKNYRVSGGGGGEGVWDWVFHCIILIYCRCKRRRKIWFSSRLGLKYGMVQQLDKRKKYFVVATFIP